MGKEKSQFQDDEIAPLIGSPSEEQLRSLTWKDKDLSSTVSVEWLRQLKVEQQECRQENDLVATVSHYKTAKKEQ